MKKILLTTLLIGALFFQLVATVSSAEPEQLTVLFSTNVKGELEACG